MTDTAFIGNLGKVELGAVAIGATAFTSSFWIFSFLIFGVTPRVARAIGAQDEDQASAIGVLAVILAVVTGLLLTTAGLLFAPAVVRLLGGTGEVAPLAEMYLRIRVLSSAGVLVTLVGHGWFRGYQDTRTPMIVAMAGAAFHILLDYILIYPVGWGVAGAAWSTVFGQAATGVVFLYLMTRRMTSKRWHLDFQLMRSFLKVGLDLIVRSGALVAGLAFATSMAARMGIVELGAWQITMQMFLFLALSLDSIAIAAQAMIGKRLGTSSHDLALDTSRRLLGWGSVLGIFVGMALFLFRGQLASVFTDDPAVTDLSAQLFGWLGLVQPLAAIAFTLDGILIGASDTRILAITMVASSAIFMTIAFLSLRYEAGVWGLAAGMTVWLVLRSLSLGVRLRHGRWVLQP